VRERETNHKVLPDEESDLRKKKYIISSGKVKSAEQRAYLVAVRVKSFCLVNSTSPNSNLKRNEEISSEFSE